MTSNTSLPRNIARKNILKPLAMCSIALYLFLLIIFESQTSSLARLASLGLYICLGFCGVYILSQKKIKLSWITVALLVFGVLLSISILYTKASATTVNTYIYRYWTSIVLIFFIANVPDSPRDLHFLINVLIVSAAILALYMYVFYGWDYLVSAEERLDDAFGNQNNTAVRCAFAIIFSVYKITTQKGIRRFLWLIPAAICLPAVMFLASRKSILMIGVGLFTLFFAYSKNKNIAKKALLIVLVLAVLWYLINNVPAFSVIKDRFDEMFAFFEGNKGDANEGDLNRQAYIQKSIAAFLESPIIGKGFYYSQYLLGVYSHNNFIELLMNNGVIGFATYYFCYGKLFFDMRRLKSLAPDAHAFILTTVMTLIALDIGVVSYFNRYTLFLLTLCAITVPIMQGAQKKDSGKNSDPSTDPSKEA